ncbi:MAG TPA: S41 family peptidase [Chitinophagales bacterium]|nr:S41 family peptidase [Chitinophagales bacterium]
MFIIFSPLYTDVLQAFKQFKHTKAIIIDHRKYGGGNRHIYVHYLTNKNRPYAMIYTSNHKFFGTYKKVIYQSNFLRLSYFKKKYKGKVVVLIDENTASSMELQTMCIQSTGRVILIGRNTGGYDGVCVPFLLRSDFGAAYTEDAVFYPDGKQTQRIGIIPDIYVHKNYIGVKRGRDEILERAIEYVKETTK